MQLFNNAKIEVIRIGLQNTEEITDPSEESSQVIAGPYHPAFRQLVESGMWYDEIVQKIKKFNINKSKKFFLYLDKLITFMLFYKRCNLTSYNR